MKKLLLVLSILFAGFAITETYAVIDGGKKEVKEVVLDCNMNCQSCSNAVEKQLSFTKGVRGVEADYEKNQVTVKYLPSKTNPQLLIEALAEINYKASVCNVNETEKVNNAKCKQPCKKPCNNSKPE